MNNTYRSKLKTSMMLLVAAGLMYSCNLETISDDFSDADLQNEQILKNADMLAPAVDGSCEDDCIEAGSEAYYPMYDMAIQSVGINTKSVSYSAYNTETDFVVEVTYAITAGPSDTEATITIDIDGDEVEYTGVSSGSTVSHTVALPEDWTGCDQVAFRVVQEGLGTPITFSESYALIPVCEEESLEIGMEYQGGIIAYILQPGDPGYDATKTHGIIAAPSDQSTGIVWGSYTTIGTTGTALGTGQANTTAIVDVQGDGNYAAQLCNNLVLNGYSDWYLPSKDELNKLYLSKDAVGGFVGSFNSGYYWSSTEYDSRGAGVQGFVYGNQVNISKLYAIYVRAVRGF